MDEPGFVWRGFCTFRKFGAFGYRLAASVRSRAKAIGSTRNTYAASAPNTTSRYSTSNATSHSGTDTSAGCREIRDSALDTKTGTYGDSVTKADPDTDADA
jgi:hypothetical protein